MIEPWIQIDKYNFKDCKELLNYMSKNKIFYSPWISDIINKNNYSFEKYTKETFLYRIKLEQLNFSGPTKLIEVYKKAKMLDYKLVDPAIAILTRIFYIDQPIGEWLRFATPMDSMIDSDRVPHLPKLGKALNTFFIETYWAYPDAIFHPHNEFVFTK